MACQKRHIIALSPIVPSLLSYAVENVKILLVQ